VDNLLTSLTDGLKPVEDCVAWSVCFQDLAKEGSIEITLP
jgi:hypothetical protein